MARCQRCGAGTEEGAAFCSRCGSPAARPGNVTIATAPPSAAAPTNTLLARANLLRMRARWEEAAALCAEVLRLEPGNASAHSLLGDIHENQGHLEEAIHWYDLALGLNRRSEADSAKRARVQELLEARRRRAEWQAAIRSAERPPGWGAALRETVLRILAVAGAAVCAGILVTAIVLSATGERERTPADSGLPTRSLRHPPGSPLPLAMSQRERRLWMELTEAGWAATDHGQIAALTIDPTTDTLTLTMILPPGALHQSTVVAIREAIQRDCYWIAYQVHLRDHALSAIRVHAVGDTAFSGVPTGQDLLFAGTLRAEKLIVDPAVPPTREDLETFYERPWWDSRLEA